MVFKGMKKKIGRPFFLLMWLPDREVSKRKKKTRTQMKKLHFFCKFFLYKIKIIKKKVLTTYLVFYLKFIITIETYKLKKNKRKHFFLHLKKNHIE